MSDNRRFIGSIISSSWAGVRESELECLCKIITGGRGKLWCWLHLPHRGLSGSMLGKSPVRRWDSRVIRFTC